MTQTLAPPTRPPLRLWPALVIVSLQWLLRFALPSIVPDAMSVALFSGLAGGPALLAWWLCFSRAPWLERLGALVLLIAVPFATVRVVHVSIATGGMGMLFPLLLVPVLSLAFVAWATGTRRFTDGFRRVSMVVTIVLACGVWTLIRTAGLTGNGDNELAWRWSETPEERLIAGVEPTPSDSPRVTAPAKVPAEVPAQADEKRAERGSAPTAIAPVHRPDVATSRDATPPDPHAAALVPVAEWPGFRGAGRDGIARGVAIATDWITSPPIELWRRPIGPGWSSFAVDGDRLYTQEQRGDAEVVACYDARTGEPVWHHRATTRFWESNSGPGPRGTPTLHNGRVYTFGATGIVNVLDARDGTLIWSRNAASDTKTNIPYWGFASSPLVVDEVVVIAAAGNLVAYDVATGKPRWFGPAGKGGYSSPHLLTIDGVPQIVLLSGTGATSVAPADGKVLWRHAWPGGGIVQPAVTANGEIVIHNATAYAGNGTRLIAVANGADGWTVNERWTSIGLKPYFNDFVVHKGHAFGFDGRILACINLQDGTRKWKGGRYGNGQLVLLPDRDLLLVLSEEGELALVAASPDALTELARFPALDGKTWNHPVVVRDRLFVRNDREMVAFRLPIAAR